MVFADQCWYKSMAPLMEIVRDQMGDRPVYFTFDIDGIDPTACPGTGKYILPSRNPTNIRKEESFNDTFAHMTVCL